MNLLAPIDAVIDRVTMYRLLIYYLIFLLLAAVGLSLFGDLRFSWWSILGATSILVAVCWSLNRLFGWLFRAPLNTESSLITAGILALIITPDLTKLGIAFLLAVSGLAIASKYVFAVHRRHIFNPAAFAVLATSLAANQTPSWWVGSAVMLPFVLIGGMVLARKLRKLTMLSCFFAFTALVTGVLSYAGHGDPLTALRNLAISSPLFFLGFVMLTEPQTAPSNKRLQVLYGGIVGLLLPPQMHIFNFYASPELALIVGNIFAYVTDWRAKLFPVLKQKLQIAANTADFVFTSNQPFTYEPGQYIELTLPHAHADARGERRYFTLASSPTEPELRIGAKFSKPSSSFKKAMLAMTAETPLAMGQLAGDFTLPKDPTRKLAFIAGGIGITPFRSMTQYLIDTGEQRDVVMLYSARTAQDVAYASVFEAARKKFGMRTTYVLNGEPLTKQGPHTITGVRIDFELLARVIPDYQERLFYISGTHSMVDDIQQQLLDLGVPRRRIKIDFFPGYA